MNWCIFVCVVNRSKNVVILKLADCMNHGAATAGISNCCDLNVELGSRFGVKRGAGTAAGAAVLRRRRGWGGD